MKLAIDTETTGSHFHLGDAPYYISTCDEEGYLKCWRFRVNPYTRAVEIPRAKIKEVTEYLRGYDTYVFHNAKFDLAALEAIEIDLRSYPNIDTIHLAHLIDNRQSRKLKDLATLYLDCEGQDWSAEDETELLQAINQSRRFIRKNHTGKVLSKLHKWAITPGDDAEDGEDGEHWMKVDAWIPGQLALVPEVWDVLPHETLLTWTGVLEKYGTKDAQRTMALCILLLRYLREHESESNPDWKFALNLQSEAMPAFMEMERYGVSLIPSALQETIVYHESKSLRLESELQETTGVPDFNPRSPTQLSDLLFESLALPTQRITKSGQPSTDEDTLLTLIQSEQVKGSAKLVLKKILAHRKNDTMIRYLNTYQSFRVGSRLHSSFNQVGTDTTRSSSSRPNMQNVGKGEEYDDAKAEILGEVTEDDYLLRRVFGPQPGRVWLDYDYDQLQLRIFAYLSQDPKLIKAFEEGWDAHNFMGSQIFGTDTPSKLQRRIAKNVNFAFIFGAGANKITAVSGDPTIWPTVNRLFPDAVKYMESTIREVRNTGKVMLHGYPLSVPRDANGQIKAYTGVVYKVQGVEGLIVKRAMKLCRDYLELLRKSTPSFPREKLPFAFLSLLVHDELIFDFRRPKRIDDLKPHGTQLRLCMEKAGTDLGVVTPASCSIVSESWDQGDEVQW